jgi:SNF2 family DNA or RNA helicase
MQSVDDKVLLVKTTEPKIITDNIKKSAVYKQDGDTYEVAVKWGLKEAKALMQLGVASPPSPIKGQYKWTGKHKPFDHQKETASFLTLNDKAFCFNEQGTGKTASVIWAADYLMKLGEIKRILVLCPLSIMKAAWQQDLFTFAMHRSCSVAHGTSKQREKIIKAGNEFVILNFDGLAVVEDAIINGGFDLIVVDEASAYKNAQTNRWKVLNRIINAIKPRLWMLTGTPAAQSPLDAYGLAKLVNPDNCPKYYGSFRDSVMYKATQFKWVAKPQAESIVHRVLQPAIRFEKKDCLDLPDVTYMGREAPLTKMQFAYYKVLKDEMLFEAAGEEVSAVNAATKINKLLQISGGAVYSDTGEVIEFDVSNRINAVIEVIEESSHKVLVFVPFTHTIQLLQDALIKHGISCDVINGKVPVNRRSEIVQEFQTRKDPHVLIIQPQAASHGLTLTAANTVIWYAPVTSVETYLQANARINRPGQKNNMTVVHIRGSDVEAKLYHMLQHNITNHEKIIDLYRQIADDPA